MKDLGSSGKLFSPIIDESGNFFYEWMLIQSNTQATALGCALERSFKVCVIQLVRWENRNSEVVYFSLTNDKRQPGSISLSYHDSSCLSLNDIR